jgi:hypothetical protein
MKKVLWFIPVMLLTGIIFLGCQSGINNPSDNSFDKLSISSTCDQLEPSSEGIVPLLVSGNTPPVNEFNVKIDPPISGQYPLGPGFVTFEIVNTSCGQVVNWYVTGPIQINYVYIKGGSNYLLYDYTGKDPRPESDNGLHSPIAGGSGKYANVSHLNFVWSPLGQTCFTETAWADGSPYNEKGNWALYTPYFGVGKTVDLIAGQNYVAGEVSFSAPVDGFVTITVTFNTGWGLQDVINVLKVQDYDSAPSGNPAPGQFDHKSQTNTIVVPENDFYGVHVDVKNCE